MILQMKEHHKEHDIFRFPILNIAGLRQKKRPLMLNPVFLFLKSEKAELVYDY